MPRRAHRRHAVGELGLADAAQLGRAVLAVHRMAVDEHGADDVVAGLGVGQQVVEHVVVAGALPEMMVRIDDRQLGLERRLAHLGDPVEIGRHHVAERAACLAMVSSVDLQNRLLGDHRDVGGDHLPADIGKAHPGLRLPAGHLPAAHLVDQRDGGDVAAQRSRCRAAGASPWCPAPADARRERHGCGRSRSRARRWRGGWCAGCSRRWRRAPRRSCRSAPARSARTAPSPLRRLPECSVSDPSRSTLPRWIADHRSTGPHVARDHAPAPMMASSPTVTPGRMIAPPPIQSALADLGQPRAAASVFLLRAGDRRVVAVHPLGDASCVGGEFLAGGDVELAGQHLLLLARHVASPPRRSACLGLQRTRHRHQARRCPAGR